MILYWDIGPKMVKFQPGSENVALYEYLKNLNKNDHKNAKFIIHLNCHPEYQLQNQFASYLIMIATIILTLETSMRGECDIEWFNLMSIVMATGFMANDLEHMYMLAYNVRTESTRSTFGIIADFFSNGYYSYRLLGHTSYVGGSVLKVKILGILRQNKINYRRMFQY